MEKLSELREMWRKERVQRLIARLQSKQKEIKPFSSKLLGVTMSKSKLEYKDTAPSVISSKSNESKSQIVRKCHSRSKSEPKIIPRDTKLSLQRKSILDPNYELKKYLEQKSILPLGKYSERQDRLLTQEKKKPVKFSTRKLVKHSCTNLTDVPPARETRLPIFSPLVKGLDSWLKKRGKTFTSLRNLNTVSTKEPVSYLLLEPDEKENILPLKRSLTFTSTSTSTSSGTVEKNTVSLDISEVDTGQDIKRMLEGALEDLCTVIRLGYPVKECEGWLNAMRSHYPDLTKYPLYWECKASINSKMGIKQDYLAVPDQKVNSQVTDLVKKMEYLNLATPKPERLELSPQKKNRALNEINVNNMLNSSSIQFSVKKKDKILEDSFVVTPVRRSARKNRCLIHNPQNNIKCVQSLLELSPEIRQKMEFEPNQALLNN